MIISKKHQQHDFCGSNGASFKFTKYSQFRTLILWFDLLVTENQTPDVKVKAFKILKFSSAPNLDLYVWGPGPSSARIRCWKGEWRHQAAPARSRGGRSGSLSCNYNSAPGPAACMLPLPRTHTLAPRTIRSIRRFVITEKDPTRAFSWLTAPTSDFTFKTRLRQTLC